jgi:hypothetical protein
LSYARRPDVAEDQKVPDEEPLTETELDAVVGGMGDKVDGMLGEAGLGEAL